MNHLFFDAAGTIIVPAIPVSETYFEAGRSYGSRLTRAQVRHRFQSAFAQLFRPHKQNLEEDPGGLEICRTSEAEQEDRWRKLVANVFSDVAQVDELFQELWNRFANPESWQLLPDVERSLDRLKRDGWPLGLASNFDKRLISIVGHFRPLQSLDHVFISSQLGWEKPATQFFHLIAERVGTDPANCLMIGDDWHYDVAAARSAGWRALWLNRQGAMSDDDSIISLAELSEHPIYKAMVERGRG